MAEPDLDATMDEVLEELREADEPDDPVEVEPAKGEKPVVEEPEVESEIQAEAEPEEAEEEEPAVAVDPSIVNPPSTWRAGPKTKWASIDPEIRAEIKKRETDAMNGMNMLRGKADQADRFTEVMKPYAPIIQAEGGTPETVVAQMLNSAYVLRQGTMQQKVQMTAQLAQQYGFVNELRALFTQGVVPTAPAGIQPQQVEALVEQRIRAMEAERSSSSMASEIESFANAVNADGSLKHPYYDNVRVLMAAQFESGRATTLEQAYESAIWADPDTRAVLQQQQKHQDQTIERVEKAKKANANNLRKKPSHASTQPAPTGSVDDTLDEALAEIKARSA